MPLRRQNNDNHYYCKVGFAQTKTASFVHVLSNLTWSLSNPKLHNSVTMVSYAAPVTEKRNAIHVHLRH